MKNPAKITPSEILKNPPSALIDVLTPESFMAEHLPGSQNHCVYEIAFAENVKSACTDSSAALVVYGLGDHTQEAKTAASKLTSEGFTNVKVLEGGLQGWKDAGHSIEGTGNSISSSLSGKFPVDPAASIILWTGQNLFNHHSGSLRLSTGEIELLDGQINKADFVVDMTSIACSDISDATMNALLVNHLKHSDFFETSTHPTASFKILNASPISGVPDGSPNFLLTSEITIKSVTKPIEFPAVIARRPDGGFTAQAHLDLDRTDFGVIYGSGKFFSRLGQHLVNDHMHLHLKIATQAAG